MQAVSYNPPHMPSIAITIASGFAFAIAIAIASAIAISFATDSGVFLRICWKYDCKVVGTCGSARINQAFSRSGTRLFQVAETKLSLDRIFFCPLKKPLLSTIQSVTVAHAPRAPGAWFFEIVATK